MSFRLVSKSVTLNALEQVQFSMTLCSLFWQCEVTLQCCGMLYGWPTYLNSAIEMHRSKQVSK